GRKIETKQDVRRRISGGPPPPGPTPAFTAGAKSVDSDRADQLTTSSQKYRGEQRPRSAETTHGQRSAAGSAGVVSEFGMRHGQSRVGGRGGSVRSTDQVNVALTVNAGGGRSVGGPPEIRRRTRCTVSVFRPRSEPTNHGEPVRSDFRRLPDAPPPT